MLKYDSSDTPSGFIKRLGRRKLKTYTPEHLEKFKKKAKNHSVPTETLLIFSQQLSAMLKAGLPLVETLKALEQQSEDPLFGAVVREIGLDVSNGTPFSSALSKFSKTFPNLFISMAEAGEASGLLAEMMEKVSSYFKSSVGLAKKVKSALVYPAVVISMAVILVGVLLTFVVPVFSDMFNQLGAELPAPTQLLIDISSFLQSNILYVIASLVIIFYSIKSFIATPAGKKIKDKIAHRLPIVGNLSNKVAVARFCRTYAILLKSGVSLLRCIQICSNASNNTFIELACTDIARVVNQGGQLSEAIADDPYFPVVTVHMVQAGEKTGNVDGMLNSVAEFFETEIDNIVTTLTSIMEPFMIAFLGVVVGSIVIAMFMPIFQLSSVVAR